MAPFTFIVALASAAVGVTFTEAVAFTTEVVYVVVLPTVPVLTSVETGVSATVAEALLDGARVMAIA
jgi:hypothetical protein